MTEAMVAWILVGAFVAVVVPMEAWMVVEFWKDVIKDYRRKRENEKWEKQWIAEREARKEEVEKNLAQLLAESPDGYYEL